MACYICQDCDERECVLIPDRIVAWMTGRNEPEPVLAPHYRATYEEDGNFSVDDAPEGVRFINWDTLENEFLSDVVTRFDDVVMFLVACRVACPSCWEEQEGGDEDEDDEE